MSQYDADVNAPGEFLTVDEAAEYLGVSRRTLERLVKSEGIRRFKRPGDRRHFFARADLDRHRGFKELPSRYDPG